MSAQKIRTTVGRFVVIGSLAIAVVAGSVAVTHPSQANAMPRLTCAQATQLGNSWTVYGDWLAAYGYVAQATTAYARADAYYDICNSWA
jgi:hypothetical protein